MFFTKGEVAKKATYTPAAESLKGDCEKCKAYKTTKHPKMQHAGQGKKKILIVGEFLTQDADQRSTHFGVQEQEMLLSAFERNDISLYRDCWLLNAHRCVPTEEPGKLSKYVKFCQKYLHAAVLELKPEYILLMGRWAITGFYHPHYAGSEGSYNPNRWRGLCIKDQKYNAVVSCTYSPFEIYMDAHDPAYHMLFSKDIDLFCEQIHNQEAQKIQKIDYEKYVSVLTDFPSVVSLLERILKNKINITFDYETTGLKPFSKGHKIALVGIALSETEGYCFPLQYKNTWTKEEGGKIISLWKEILKDKEIKKNNHNILFEDVWSAGILKTRLRGVEWDTQLAAHIIDNRRMYTGLKFQTYIHFGVLSYDEHIHPYLVTNKDSEFNNVEQAPFKDLSIYCALDCIFSLRLMNIQKELLWHPSRRKQYSAFLFYKKGLGVMSELQINGISSDLDYFQNMNNEVLQIVQELENELLTGKEAKLFREQEKRDMKLTAKDIGILLHKVLKYKGEQTDKGNWKVDKNALSNIKSAFTQKYTELQKYRKINNSFFSNYIYFTSGDKRIHGSFSINHVISYRSAANDPNMQNMSKRDKEAKNLLRTGFLPDPGSVLVEADFSGAEVNVSASTHGDKNFIRYLLDPTSDMHNDCFDIRTEILTENGFKLYKDIGENERIAQYNEKTDKIEFVHPTHRVYYTYNGEMYRMKNYDVDVLVTPNHRLYLGGSENHKFGIVKAKDATKKRYLTKHGADLAEELIIQPPDTFHFEAVYGEGYNSWKKYHEEFSIKAEDMFELLGYLITDGHFKYHKQKAYRINLMQVKPEHKKKMKECIDRIKAYTDFKFHEEVTRHIWSMSNKNLCTWLCDNFGVNKKNRTLPAFIKYAPLPLLKKFFDACILGDGSHPSANCINFYCINKQMAVDFQFICMRLGYSSRIFTPEPPKGRTVQVYYVVIHTKKHCVLTLFNKKQKEVRINERQYQIEHYSGPVFCFTVPSGLLVIRRNSKISIQGNCSVEVLKMEEYGFDYHHMQGEGKERLKRIRNMIKNKWVFAQFYGDWYKSCAKSIWEDIHKEDYVLPGGMALLDHLSSHGIYTLDDFTEHCEGAERALWDVRFPEYTQWKKDIYSFYLKHGYIDNYFGFRFQGYMNRKTCTNYPIQSVSFQLLVKVLIEVSKFLKKEKMKGKLVAQIHDSCVSTIPLNELDKFVNFFNETVQGLDSKYKWMKVPMKAEFEISKPREEGGNFSKMYEIPEKFLGKSIILDEVYKVYK